jgi:hypothetical protein
VKYRRRILVHLLALAAATLTAGEPAPAAPPSSDWDVLRGIKTRSCISIYGTDGRAVRGRFLSWSTDNIAYSHGRGKQNLMTRESVDRVALRPRCNSTRSVWLGAVVGFAVGFTLTAMAQQDVSNPAPALAVGGAIGVLSAFLGSRGNEQSEVLLYRRP